MGEVFRARDSRLKRDVALKVLPTSALQDLDRRARFEREAQVLASLNHTSIAQVFGVELDGDSMVIVMELVEGATLADRMARGPVPVDEAIAIAAQICDGLEAAHERGIVHRDLKPANVKIRPDGSIKILDFGIARVLTNDAPADSANSPTVLGARTDSGAILGTAAYMSPEQARGRAIDKRTDIWALGCVLFEMLSRTRAFPGDSAADIVAAIVHKEPDWSALPASTPSNIRDLLRRCFEKTPKDRLRDAGDAKFELTRPPAAVIGGAGSAPAAMRLSPILWFAAGGIAAALLLLITPLAQLLTTPGKAPAVARSVIQLPPGTSLALSRGSAVAISPDGRTLIFAGKANNKVQLYRRALDAYDATPIAGTDGATNPFLSPDGRWVGFFAEEKLKKVSLDGGAPITITSVTNARGETWASDDTIFVTPTNAVGISRVSAQGGELAAVTSRDKDQLSHRWPFALPGSSTLLYTIWNDLGWEPARTVVQKAGGAQKALIAGGGYAHYIRDTGTRGYLVYARSEGLMATGFDESSLSLTSQPVPLGDSVITNLSGGAHFDLSAAGTLAYVPGAIGEADRSLVWVTLDGKATPAISIHGLSRVWSLSTDGHRVVRNNTIGATRDVWIDDLSLGISARVPTLAGGFSSAAIFAPGGKSLVFARDAPNTNIFRRSLEDNGTEERLTTSDLAQIPTGISPDGQTVAFVTYEPTTGSDIWMLSLADKSVKPFVKTSAIEGSAVFSPDGRWVAYQSNDSGRFETFVRPFPAGQPVVRVSTDGGIFPIWSPDGRSLLYRNTALNKIVAVDVSLSPSFRLGQARPLFDVLGYESTAAFAPDGKRLLMMPVIATEQSSAQINIVQNFIAELRARVK